MEITERNKGIEAVFIIIHEEGEEIGRGRNTFKDAISKCAEYCFFYDKDNVEIISAGFSLNGNPPIQSWDQAGLDRIKGYIEEELEGFREIARQEKEGQEAIERDYMGSI